MKTWASSSARDILNGINLDSIYAFTSVLSGFLIFTVLAYIKSIYK